MRERERARARARARERERCMPTGIAHVSSTFNPCLYAFRNLGNELLLHSEELQQSAPDEMELASKKAH